MNFRTAMVLAINSTILAVLFAFSSWLYLSSRREVERGVQDRLTRTQAMTGYLAELREVELQNLAQSLAVSPLLKGALSTRDKETIQDVLSSLAEKNSLDAVVVLRQGRPVFASRDGLGALSELEKGRFLGGSDLPGDHEASLVAASLPSAELLRAWSKITGARFAVLAQGSSEFVEDLPAGQESLLSKKPESPHSVISSEKDKFYAREFPLLGERFAVRIFLPYAPFWSGFESLRNSLVLLGGGLFLCGLIASSLFAAWIERYARPDSVGGTAQGLLAEIETVRASLIKNEAGR